MTLEMKLQEVREEAREQGILQGISQGTSQGQNKLITAINLLRNGLTDDEILAQNIDQHTLDLAKTVR